MADQSYQTPERLAISAALTARWDDAIQANLEILAKDPENTAALNRIGIAYLKTKQPGNAKKAFTKVLSLDQFNTIAKTNLKKASPKFSRDYDNTTILSNHTFSFIEEPGKSKVISLANIGEPSTAAKLYTGMEVELKIAARKVKVVTLDKHQYIGSLPDDISSHLIRLIKAGYKYQTLIKSVDTTNIQVFIKEIKSSKRLKGLPSFTSSQNLDDLDITSAPPQPPLEIYDPVVESD